RARALGVIVVQNPSHVAFADIFAARYGESHHYMPARSLLEAGIPLALGSDGPLNPYLNLLFATTHPGRPSEALTIAQAVEAYTHGAAHAEFEEEDKGTLAPGKLADLAVLSEDIFAIPPDRLFGTESVLTMVGGETAYDSGVLSASGNPARLR